MSAQQQIVAVGGASLVVLQLVNDKKTRDAITKPISQGSSDDLRTEDYTAGGRALGKIGLELLFVGGLTLAAGFSRAWGSAMAAVVIGLAILYAVQSPHGPAMKQAAGARIARHDKQQTR